jgi:TDG/mug DNA glycosylase family protein
MYRELPDYLRPGLNVVFVGFNPSRRAAETGHYYANPRNQFWDLLFESELVPQKLKPEDDYRLPDFRLGLTDVVKRWSKSANELRPEDYRQNAPRLLVKLRRVRPRVVAFNGKGAYKEFSKWALKGFNGPMVELGWQSEALATARVFVLPSTSPANARLRPADKLRYFRQLARWVKKELGD